MKPIGIGIIGCGGRVRGLARHLLEVGGEAVKVVALSDVSETSIQRSLEALDADATVYADYRHLVADERVDWVMIGSFNRYHPEHMIAAVEAGKDVFCEKPIATTVADCHRMLQARDRTGRRVYVGFTLRHSPHYRKIRSLLDEGVIGDLISFEFNETLGFNHGGYIHRDWRRWTEESGGHLLEKCCHDVDLAWWMVGALPARVASFGGRDFFIPENVRHVERVGPNANGKPAYATWDVAEPCDPFTNEKDIVDNQVVLWEYANGVRCTFHTNCNAAIPERRMYLLGSEGAIRADVLTGVIEHRRIGWTDESVIIENSDSAGGHGGGDSVMIEELLECMQNPDVMPKATLEGGLVSAIASLGADESMRTGQVVDLLEQYGDIKL